MGCSGGRGTAGVVVGSGGRGVLGDSRGWVAVVVEGQQGWW